MIPSDLEQLVETWGPQDILGKPKAKALGPGSWAVLEKQVSFWVIWNLTANAGNLYFREVHRKGHP